MVAQGGMMKRAIAVLSVFLLGCQPLGSVLTPVFFEDDPSLPQSSEPQAILWVDSAPKTEIALNKRAIIDRDYTQDFYQWSAESGYPQGQQVYGLLLIYDKNELSAGLDWLHQSLAQKYVPASLDLAWLFMSGQKVEPNLELALQYLQVGLEASDKEAFRIAAQISLLQNDTTQAIRYLEQAASLGDMQSQRDLAQLIIEQRRGSWREAQALMSQLQTESLLEEAADLDKLWTSHPYQSQNAVPVAPPLADTEKNEEKGLLKLPYTPSSYPGAFLEQFERYADQGSPYAAYQAVLQRLNNPTATAPLMCSKTLKELLDQAAQVLVPAQVLKARLILRDYFQGLGPQDAYVLLEKAAQQNDPYALFAMSAWMRQMGEYELSLDYYHKAISQQNYDAALYQVVFDMIEGYYPLQQEQLAFDWLMILSQHFYNPALLLLADLKEKNVITGTDAEIFMHRYQAAWQGDPQAQYAVGNMYLKGCFVAANPQKAFRWFYQSAYRGYRPAQYQIALHYSKGIGVVPDLPKAYAWRRVAGAGLYENDQQELQSLAWSMNQEQLERAISLERIYSQYFTQGWVGRHSF